MLKYETMQEYSEALLYQGETNQRIVVVDCDLGEPSGTKSFRERFPHRYINVGIAEQNAVGVAAGLASEGFIPLVHSFSMFASLRTCEQIRNSLCYTNMNVKVVGTRAGISNSYLGATHHAIEDIAVMSSIPNMVVVSPCDGKEVRNALKASIEYDGPVYLRINKTNTENISKNDFMLGKASVIRDGRDLTLIGTGDQVINCVKAADTLMGYGLSVRVVNMSTIKPVDEQIIVESAKRTGAVVVAETGNMLNGLGAQVCRVVCRERPVPVRIVGINDSFTETGSYYELMHKYRIDENSIVKAALESVNFKVPITAGLLDEFKDDIA